MLKRSGLHFAIGLALATLAAGPAFAQSTSAALSGRITDPAGKAIAGATVEIVHTPSGSRRTITTDGEGRFDARGLRVGGPYTVTSTAAGVETATEENVFVNLDEVSTLNLVMASTETQTLEEVTVTASASTLVFSPDNMGARTNITKQEIEAFPSIGRTLQDYVRFDPRIVQTDKERGQISAAGQNNRYNNIKIDGVPTNDQFGLNDSGLPSLNQPISIDWIQEFNVGISNYDVTQSDATGANINAVTKSGGNEFHGAVYGNFRNNDMVSDKPSEFRAFEDEWTAGGYVGGPIVEDTLFFFLGYEEFERSGIAPDVGLIGSGASTEVQGVTQADLDRIRQIAQTQYNFDVGSFTTPNASNTDEKVFAKVDWNINDAHRLTYRYNNTEGQIQRLPNLGRNAISLSSNWYEDNISFENHAAILYSNWTDNFSTEAQLSYSEYRSNPVVNTQAPQVRVGVNNNATGVTFGTERSRHANVLAVDTLTGGVTGDWFLGDHTVRMGFDYEGNDIFNLFLQDVYGNYNFRSIDDFAAGRWASYTLQFPLSGDVNSAAAQFEFANLGLFLQDSWTVNDQLSLLYGVRLDKALVDNSPKANAAALTAFGFDNTTTNDGEITLQPRLGFNYNFDTDRLTQLRGGVGLFLGSAPGVWLSNTFSNPGVLSASIPAQNGTGFSADPFNQPRPAGTPPAANVDFLAPGFSQPTVWKANLAFERELPWYGLIGSLELLHTQTEQGVTFSNLNLGGATGFLPDGRVRYWSSVDPTRYGPTGPNNTVQNRNLRNRNFNNVILLGNTNKGNATNVTLGLEKPFADNWGAKASYTYGKSNETSPGTSSVAFSNWLNRSIYNPNEIDASTANYEIRDRFTGALNYRWNLWEGNPTTFGLFYDGRSGRPYSYGFTGDANGDGVTGNDLFFIPSPGQVGFTSASTLADQAAFFDYINNDDYLREHQGLVAGRNTSRSPRVNQFDLRINQDLPGFFSDHKASIFLDIQNIGNLLNKEWGQIDEVGFPYNLGVARFAGVNAAGQYVYDVSTYVNETTGAVTLPSTVRRDAVGESRWSLQLGFRYEF